MRRFLTPFALTCALLTACGGSGESDVEGSQSGDAKVIAYSDLPPEVQSSKRANCEVARSEASEFQTSYDELDNSLAEEGRSPDYEAGMQAALGALARYIASNPQCFSDADVAESYDVLSLD